MLKNVTNKISTNNFQWKKNTQKKKKNSFKFLKQPNRI